MNGKGPRMIIRPLEEILEYTRLLGAAYSQCEKQGDGRTKAAVLIREHLQVLAWVLSDPAGNSIARMIEDARKHQSAIEKKAGPLKNSTGKDKK